MFKAPTLVLETIILSYRQQKDAAAFINLNKAMYRYVGLNFKVGGPMSARAILSVTEPDLKLPGDPDDTTGKVSFLK